MAGHRSRTVFKGRDFTVIAVESVELRSGGTKQGRHLTASIKPVAVIICETDRTYAVDMDAKPLGIDRLTDIVPDLEDALA